MADPTHSEVLGKWIERDLTAAAEAGELTPAFHVDDAIAEVSSVIEEGRSPILAGPSGVGKTAVIHEVTRRAAAGSGPAALVGRRVAQLSIRRCAASLKDRNEIGWAVQELVTALAEMADPIVPYFRDFDAAHSNWLMPQLELLAHRLPGPILAEGSRRTLDTMFEDYPEMHDQFVLVYVSEPPLERARAIVRDWCEDQTSRTGRRYGEGAQYEALQLAHRFLTRGHLPRNALELLRQAGSSAAGDEVTEGALLDRFCRTHRVPRELVDPALVLDIDRVRRDFDGAVLGQPEAVEAVVQIVGLVKAGLSSPARPLGTLLFAGPTGVGKTHMARVLAEYLFGSAERMIRVNMTDYQKPESAEVLFGNPYAHNASLVRGTLTNRLAGRPFTVLLLDEFEKANPAVQDGFMQLFDEGVFINGANETVSCRSLIVIATTNAGAEVLRSPAIGFSVDDDDLESQLLAMNQALRDTFRIEMLNRFDRVVQFGPLDRAAIRAIALRELEELKARPGVRRRGLDIEIDLSVVDWLVVNGFDPEYGARFLKRTIERHVTVPLASAIVRARAELGQRFELNVRANRIVARPASTARQSRAERATVARPVGTGRAAERLSAAGLDRSLADLAASAEVRLAELEVARGERSALLERMNAADFWEADRADNEKVLDRYRERDVIVETESRLAAPIVEALELRARLDEVHVKHAARVLERALEALHEWDERRAEEGPSTVWLVISAVDALRPPADWIGRLVAVETRWCGRLGLEVEVVGYAGHDDSLRCVALRVDGAGAGSLLEMEHGIHTLALPRGAREKVRVEVIGAPPGGRMARGALRDRRHRKGQFGLVERVVGRLDVAPLGMTVDFLGADRRALNDLLAVLNEAWRKGMPTLERARVYGDDGHGARDPRTAGVVVRPKDVAAGQLDVLLEAWRTHKREAGRSDDGDGH